MSVCSSYLTLENWRPKFDLSITTDMIVVVSEADAWDMRGTRISPLQQGCYTSSSNVLRIKVLLGDLQDLAMIACESIRGYCHEMA